MGAVLVNRDGVVWSDAVGVRRRGRDEAAALEDRWHLGSNTKAMTALAFARLVEAGQASWDAPVADYFPGMDPAWSGVTIEPFLAHRAGLLDQRFGAWFMTARSDTRSLTDQRRAVVEAALAVPPDGEGGAYAYGNLNYMLAGAVMEAITGQSAEDILRDQVFQPLGLASAGFGAPPDPAPWGHRDVFGQLVPMEPDHPGADNPLALGPAGTAHMSLHDYGRWLRVFLGVRPEGFVTDDSLGRLTRPWPDAASDYALGWGVAEPAWSPAPLLAHEGSNTMWRCAAMVSPASGMACAVVANRDTNQCGALAGRLMRSDQAI